MVVDPLDAPIREIAGPIGTATSIRDSRGGLDQVSKRIIEQLQQDGRRSYAAIARAVGLSEAATRQRVQRLLDERIIQIAAVTDAAAVGAAAEGAELAAADGAVLAPELEQAAANAEARMRPAKAPERVRLFIVISWWWTGPSLRPRPMAGMNARRDMPGRRGDGTVRSPS